MVRRVNQMEKSNLKPEKVRYNVLKKLYDKETSKDIKLMLMREMVDIVTEEIRRKGGNKNG